MPTTTHHRWTLAAASGLVGGVTLACFAYTFLVADRYAIFLYYHLGATPEAPITRSRYWMTGLVTAGVVLVLYLLLGLVLRRAGETALPPWGQGWGWSALPVALGIWAITVGLGRPPIAPVDATATIAATWAGLALALASATALVQRPVRALAVVPLAAALTPLLVLVHAVDLVDDAPAVTARLAWSLALGSTAGGWLAVALLALLYRRRGLTIPSTLAVLTGSLTVAYVVLPLVHFVLFTPAAYKYVSAAENFFARSLLLQAGIIALAWGVARSAIGTMGRTGRDWQGRPR